MFTFWKIFNNCIEQTLLLIRDYNPALATNGDVQILLQKTKEPRPRVFGLLLHHCPSYWIYLIICISSNSTYEFTIASSLEEAPIHSNNFSTSSNNLVQQDVDCSKADEKDAKQDSKYLQPRWCPSGLSHTQKRRLQRMRKEAMEQQVEAVPKTSATMKKVWWPKQIVSTST